MEAFDKITLKQATLVALIGILIGLLIAIINLFGYFHIFTLGNVITQACLALFFFKLYSKQKENDDE